MLNYVDLLIILILLYFLTGAWRRGLLLILADFASFSLSLLISLRVYKLLSEFFMANFNLVKSLGDAFGFLIAAILLETALGQAFYFIIHKLPKNIRTSKINKFLGIVPALGEGLIFIAFIP